jgi:hypothetical protein
MNQSLTEILVFKTNLITDEHISSISSMLNSHPAIRKWNVDEQDIDHVLRIVPDEVIDPTHIIQMVQEAGFYCEELPG